MAEKNSIFKGFVLPNGTEIPIDGCGNHTELAEHIVSQSKRLQKMMMNSKYCSPIDFLIYEMGYLKVGNSGMKEVVYSVNKKMTKTLEDELLIYQALGYKIIMVV